MYPGKLGWHTRRNLSLLYGGVEEYGPPGLPRPRHSRPLLRPPDHATPGSKDPPGLPGPHPGLLASWPPRPSWPRAPALPLEGPEGPQTGSRLASWAPCYQWVRFGSRPAGPCGAHLRALNRTGRTLKTDRWRKHTFLPLTQNKPLFSKSSKTAENVTFELRPEWGQESASRPLFASFRPF